MKIKNPSAIFIDLDGTTFDIRVNGQLAISKENKEAIIELNKKIPVIISTGRSESFVLPLQKELGLEYSIVQNGSFIYNNKNKIVFKDSIDKKEFTDIIEIAKKNKLSFKINAETSFYGVPFIFRKLTKSWGFTAHKGYDFKKTNVNTKIVLIGKPKFMMRPIKEQIIKKYPHLQIVSSSKGFSIEVTGQYSSKGLANQWVAKKLNVSVKDAVHFGDSMNDSTTAQFMKLIAMENSSIELKNIASIVSENNYKNGGLAKAFKECFKI